MRYDEAYGRVGELFGTDVEPCLRNHLRRLPPGRPVVDVGAGQGRHALPLARLGHEVHAIEPSAVACGQLREAAQREGLPLRVHERGFAGFQPPSPCGAVLLFGLLQMLAPEEGNALLEASREWLAPGGLLFLVAWTSEDPSFERVAGEGEPLGDGAYRLPSGEIRRFLRPGEILLRCPEGERLHHREALGTWHRHGDGPLERHHRVELVLRV